LSLFGWSLYKHEIVPV